MRVALHELAIFKCPRFTFIGIATQIFGAGVVLGHKAPFDSGGKARAPAPPEARVFHYIGDICRGDTLQHLSKGLIPTCSLIVLEGAGVSRLLHILQEDFFVLRHKSYDQSAKVTV